MGICHTVEYIDEFENINLSPLKLIKPYKYIKLKKKEEYKIKSNLYWIYYNENYFKTIR